jgi:eukaryotic-like serine/threonine-protein kinase
MNLLQIRRPAFVCLAGALSVGLAAAASPMFRVDAQHTGATAGAPRHLRLKWHFETRGKIRSTAAVASGVVCFGSEDGNLYALDATTGALKWKYATDGDLSSSPAIVDGTVYVVGGDGSFLAVALNTGKLVWQFKTGPRMKFEQFKGDPRSWDIWQSSPVAAGDRVYFGSGDGAVYALDRKTGKQVWKHQTDAVIRTAPAVANGVVYVGGFDGRLWALNQEDGRVKWSFKTEGNSYFPKGEIQGSPSVADGRVFFGARDGFVYALDAESGKQLWRNDHKGSWVPTSPAVAAGVVYAGSSDGQFVQALDAKTGAEKWRFESKSRVFSSPVLSEGRLYFGVVGGDLVALNAADGKEVARALTQNPIYASPAIADGMVYIGSDDSILYAFGASPLEAYKAIEVQAAVLDRYKGEYDTGFGLKVVVSRQGNKLIVAAPQPTAFEALSETRFFSRDLDIELDFGQSQVTMSQGGFPFPLKKL